MVRASSPYEACSELFAGYPLAADNCGGTVSSMILMLREDDDLGFFVLSRDCGEGRPSFSFRPWRAGGSVDISADGALSPDVVVNAVTSGIPMPVDGSLFGWRAGDAVTALVAVYSDYSPACPQPSWAVMPLVGIPKAQWPPFTGEPFFGQWFWEHYRAGRIVSLSGLIARTPDTVFWADTEAALGSGCCAVARDIMSREGYTVRHGRYVYHEALRMGRQVPSLGALLADDSKADLALLFRLCGHSEC